MPEPVELGAERRLDRRELRCDQVPVLAHVRAYAVGVAEELDVPQLVDLVGTDGGVRQPLEVPLLVLQRRRERGHAGAGEGDLRRRGEHDRPVGVAGRRGEPQRVRALGLDVGEVVDDVGVVPEDPEVRRRGRHRHQAGRDLVGADGTRRVGVRRHQPHALDRRVVLNQGAHGRDVRAVVVHRHGHHLDAELGQHGEVPVVAGDGADELDRLLLRPRPRGVGAAVREQPADDLVHHRQARVAARDDLRGVDAEQVGEDLTELGETLEAAVVADVGAGAVLVTGRQVQQPLGQVELVGAGLAAGEVELEALRLQVLVVGAQPGEALGELVGREVGQWRRARSRVHRASDPAPVRTRFTVRLGDLDGYGAAPYAFPRNLKTAGRPGCLSPDRRFRGSGWPAQGFRA